MSRAYTAFVAVLAVLWLVMVAIDILFLFYLYRPNFLNFMHIQFPLFVIIPLPQLITYLPGTFTAIWLGFVIAAVAAFFILILYRGIGKFENSALYRMGEFFALNYFLSVIYFLLIDYAGYPVITPIGSSTPFFENLFLLTNAGLYEELISRVAYIGIPLFLYYRYSMNGQRDPSRPSKLPWYRIVWGGGYRFGKPEITVLVASSLIFGFAHVTSWDLSKVPQAVLGGVLLGVLYLRFGLYADVLFHFSVDASSVLLPQGYGNPLATPVTTSFFSFAILIFLMAGAVVMVSYIIQARNRMVRKSSGYQGMRNRSLPAACPKCGSSDISRFYDDFYRCDSCGNIFKKDQ
jgi:predicted RNA-binding Zn-ribbon protein involved in translation (DUF1610 family)